MSWYAVYDIATGAAASFTSEEPGALPDGLTYTAIAAQPVEGEAWDAETRRVVTFTPVPADPSGALYEIPRDGAWQWAYAAGPYRLPASAVGERSLAPATAAAQAYIRADSPVDDITAAIGWAAARRDALGVALTAAGLEPADNAAYADAQAVLAFLGGCL